MIEVMNNTTPAVLAARYGMQKEEPPVKSRRNGRYDHLPWSGWAHTLRQCPDESYLLKHFNDKSGARGAKASKSAQHHMPPSKGYRLVAVILADNTSKLYGVYEPPLPEPHEANHLADR